MKLTKAQAQERRASLTVGIYVGDLRMSEFTALRKAVQEITGQTISFLITPAKPKRKKK